MGAQHKFVARCEALSAVYEDVDEVTFEQVGGNARMLADLRLRLLRGAGERFVPGEEYTVCIGPRDEGGADASEPKASIHPSQMGLVRLALALYRHGVKEWSEEAVKAMVELLAAEYAADCEEIERKAREGGCVPLGVVAEKWVRLVAKAIASSTATPGLYRNLAALLDAVVASAEKAREEVLPDDLGCCARTGAERPPALYLGYTHLLGPNDDCQKIEQALAPAKVVWLELSEEARLRLCPDKPLVRLD